MVFAGTYEHTIDAKHRVAIPAEIRHQVKRAAQAAESSGGSGEIFFYATLGEDRAALCLYTEADFERLANRLDESERDPAEILPYENVFFSLSHRLEMDRNGRIRLPENLLKMAGLGTDVVLLGAKDHLELRDRDTWQRHVDRVLAERPEVLMNPRRAMKRGGPLEGGGTGGTGAAV